MMKKLTMIPPGLVILALALGAGPLSGAVDSHTGRPAPKYWSIAHAESIMARFPDPDSIPHRPWCYTQGYILSGFEMLSEYTGDPRYFDYLLRFVDQHVDSEGNIRGFSGNSMDDMMAGRTLVAAYQKTGLPKYKLAAERVRRAFDTYPRNTDGGFLHGINPRIKGEMWIDGVFMGQMFLTRFGEGIGDRAYCLDEAARQILIYGRHGLKPGTGLYVHGYDEDRDARWANPITGLSSEVWSEGLGWYALITVETLGLLPASHPDRPALLKILQDLIEGLAQTQEPKSGLWHQVVDKGDRPDNWLESSGSGMFVYTIQRAVDLGLVNREEYEPVAKKGYLGLLTRASVNPEYGLIDIVDACDGLGVQKSYADYINYPKRINAKETMGSFLWATVIVEKPPRGATSYGRE